jgi:superfamily I DNA/RNA helicase
VDDDEHFPSHVKEVLELGKDVHLLDLNSTSIFTSKPLELYIVDIDKGDLGRLDYQDFAPQKRISYFEAQLNRTLFDSSEEEARDNEAILSGEQGGMSTSLFGGAGTGKTLLLTKKIISLPVERRILLVSRLPRLVSVIKGAVEQERDARNVTFSTYDDLLALLTRSVDFSSEEAEHHGFSPFSQVQFASATDTGIYSSVSFCDAFVGEFLEANERKVMKENQIEPITLWTAFRTIKARASCAMTKTALTRQEYIKLPPGFGLRQEQREVVYDMYLRYEEWLRHGNFKWDEADRVIHILKYGPNVYSDKEFLSWEKRVRERGELDLLDTDGRSPLSPFFYDMVFADEAQDFSELDLALLLRMSRGVRSLFLGADPAQSVELGIRMQKGTIKDVFHDHLPRNKNLQVKEVLQEIQMRTNHRTHAQNLAIATAVRRILARSFGVPESKEKALINGPIPEGLSLERLKDLANRKLFIGGDIVFLTPDEMLEALRADLHKLGIQNDVFGIREAKGLEFNAVALLGFFSYVDGLGNIREWENVLRWLSSSTGITTRQSSEKIQGRHLEDCDYGLSHPEILDQAMLLYTAITRARNHLYLIEVKELDRKRSKRSAGVDLDDFAFRRFKDLDLMIVKSINEGYVEMTPAQHKARGVLLVTQAINLSRSPTTASTTVKERFLAAADRFRPDKGDDKELLDQCLKHMDAVLLKRSLIETVKRKFFVPLSGKYDLTGRFADILTLEQDCDRFFRLCIGDSFLGDEMSDVRALMEDLFAGTPYEVRFGEICEAIRKHEV